MQCIQDIAGNLDDALRVRSNKQKLVDFLFIVVVFIVTRQVPFAFLSPIMNVCVITLLGLSLYKATLDRCTYAVLFCFLVLPLCCSLFYSIFITDNDFVLAVKFFIVLLSVGLAYFVRVDRIALRWFVGLCLLQTAVLIVIHLYLLLYSSIETYLPIRFFFMEKGWGDVYTYNGIFYRIQIKGSALLLIALVLNIEIKLFKYQYLIAIMLFTGVVLAGNFAFLISLVLYLLYKLFSLSGVKSIHLYLLSIFSAIVFASIAMPSVVDYAMSTLEMKQESSLGVRSDQFTELMKNLTESPFSLLMGQGLGNTLNVKTEFRDYTGDTYFEVQTLYVINQLGIIFFLGFILYNVLITLKRWGTFSFSLYFIYLIYITYAVTNPYIFDTNHVIVIIVLNSLQAILIKKNEYERHCSSSCTISA